MRIAIIIACLSACLVPAAASADKVLDDVAQKVPGNSPFVFCAGDHRKDIVNIERVDMTPNPPVAGQNLSISASGTVNEVIDNGAFVHLTVKYKNLITIPISDLQICDYIGEVGRKCPIQPGKIEITKEVELPQPIPPGTYDVQADVFTADRRRITCLQATVDFRQQSFSNEL